MHSCVSTQRAKSPRSTSSCWKSRPLVSTLVQSPACRAWNSFRQFLLSKYCQAGVQVAAGELVVSLFFWRSELRYSSQCLLSTLYLLCCLLIPTDNHIGSKWVTSVLLVGSAWLACLLAGTTISIARQASGHGYTVVLCVLAAVTLVPLSIIRASPNPVIGKGFGILTNIMYAVLLVNGQFVWPPNAGARVYWNYMVSHMLLNALIAAACCAVTAFVVLPSLAGDEVYSNVAAALRHTGHSLSGYSSLMCSTRTADSCAHDATAHKLQVGTAEPEAATSAVLEEEDWEYEACLKSAATGRARQDNWVLGKLVPPKSAADVQPLLQQTKALLGKVVFEPAWLQRRPFSQPAWARLLQCMGTLVTRVAGLEALLDERHMLLKQQSGFRFHFEEEMRPILMGLYSHMAAHCMLLADAVDDKLQLAQATCMGMNGCGHEAMQQQLWSAADATMVSYWDSFRQQVPDVNSPALLAPALQVRALAFTIVLTRGIMASMHDIESALADAIGQPPQQASAAKGLSNKAHAAEPTAPDIEAPVAALPQTVRHTENTSSSAQGDTCWVQSLHVQQPTANGSDPSNSVETSNLSDSQNNKAMPDSKPHDDMDYYFGFLKPLCKVFLAVAPLTWIYQVLRQSLLPAVLNPSKVKQLFSSRECQFGLKFWFATSSITAAALIVQQDWKHGRAWSPFYAVITIPIVFSERVEASTSKGVVRIAGTAAGGILAYAVMLKPDLSTRSVPLAVILLAVTFLAGCAGQTQFKTSVVLSITAFNAGVLCQFVGCCNRTGTIHYFVQQIIPISIAVGYAVLVNSGVKPWYASSDARKLLAGAFESSGQVLEQSYTALVQAVTASAQPTEGSLVEASKGGSSVVKLDGSALSLLVAAPIGKVQAMLASDVMPWSFRRLGLLTMPPVVHDTLAHLLSLLDRLTGLQLVVSQGPFLTGAFHGRVYWDHLVLPLDEGFREVISLCTATSKMSAAVLCSPDPSSVAALRQQIEALLQARVRLRAKFQQQRQLLHKAMAQADNCDYATDDSCRIQSYLFVMLKVLDQFARTAHSISIA